MLMQRVDADRIKDQNHFSGDIEDERKMLVKERLELELLRRQLERKKKDEEENTILSVDPFVDEGFYKPKKTILKTKFEVDFESKWKEKFGESYHGS